MCQDRDCPTGKAPHLANGPGKPAARRQHCSSLGPIHAHPTPPQVEHLQGGHYRGILSPLLGIAKDEVLLSLAARSQLLTRKSCPKRAFGGFGKATAQMCCASSPLRLCASTLLKAIRRSPLLLLLGCALCSLAHRLFFFFFFGSRSNHTKLLRQLLRKEDLQTVKHTSLFPPPIWSSSAMCCHSLQWSARLNKQRELLVASACAGTTAAVVAFPIDFVRTRLTAQTSSNK